MEETTRRFIEYIRTARNSAENTISAYRIDLDQFHEYFSSQKTPALTPTSYSPEQITQYIDWLEKRSYSPATVARKVAVLRTYFEYLSFIYGESTEAIVAVLRGPSGTRHAPRILNADEMNALLRAPARMRKPRGVRDSAILSLLYATGIQAAEASALNLYHIDSKQNVLYLPSGNREPIPLGNAAEAIRFYVEDARSQLARAAHEPALFLNLRGKRLSRQGIWLVVKRWAKRLDLGEDVSPRTIRNTMTVNLMKDGLSKREVQEFLGLTSPNAMRFHRRLSTRA